MYDLEHGKETVTFRTIDEFLVKKQRSMKAPEYMWGFDNNQDKRQDFETSDLRILVNFFSTGKVRAVSSTYNAIDFLIHNKSKNVFCDFMYKPESEDLDTLIENDIPVMFGNVSHRPWWEYDLLFVFGIYYA